MKKYPPMFNDHVNFVIETALIERTFINLIENIDIFLKNQ